MQSTKSNHEPQTQPAAATNTEAPNGSAQVVIVGAGLAGLAAAQRLHESGVRDVIVLDAQNRIGGRVHTVDHSDYLLELGAQWLHGADDNPLHSWLTDKNLLDDFEDASMGFQGLYCTSAGQPVEPSLVERVLDIVIASKLSLSKNRIAYESQNAAQVFRRQLDLESEKDDQLRLHKELVDGIFDWFMRYETVENSCDSMDEVSITSYTDWTDWGDGTLLNFKHGYRSLLEWFSDHMPARRWIHLNKQVISVEMLEQLPTNEPNSGWSDDVGRLHGRPMLVRYVDRQAGDESGKTTGEPVDKLDHYIECDHVIVTASLGFLKENHLTFFKPPLPEVKQDLIRSVGFGTVNKIVLQFERPFWDDDHGIKLVWDRRQRTDLPEWTLDIVTFDVVRRQPNLLIGWIGGQGAKLMERETDEQVGAVCVRLLERFLPSTYKRPSRLVACICSRWNSNPFVCGSYSFQSMKSYYKNLNKLQEPLYNDPPLAESNKLVPTSSTRSPRLLFAGEATSGKLYSTTHGAIISGWREADRLTDHLLGGKRANSQQQVAVSELGVASSQ